MIQIIDKHEQELIFDGIKIITVADPNFYIKDLLIKIQNNESKILVNNKKILDLDYLFFHEFSKIYDVLNFNKNNPLLINVLDYFSNKNLINENLIDECKSYINEYFDNEFVNIDFNFQKIISLLFSVNKSIFFTKNNFTKMLNYLKNNNLKKLIILNDVTYVNLKMMKNYVNYFDFIVITNDFRKWISDWNEIEIVSIYNNLTNRYIDLINKDLLFDYFINKIEHNIKEIDIHNWLSKKNCLESFLIQNEIFNI